ncbi:DUF6461 domain-containing protein [Streptosporangium canum]|uniref:DUF6461 domain-containing protein n=1 Tax=Streptosporangium canum TaxID=324952 RepID=UPI00343D8E7E
MRSQDAASPAKRIQPAGEPRSCRSASTDHASDTFAYVVDGKPIVRFGPRAPDSRSGSDPDRFIAEMHQAGLDRDHDIDGPSVDFPIPSSFAPASGITSLPFCPFLDKKKPPPPRRKARAAAVPGGAPSRVSARQGPLPAVGQVRRGRRITQMEPADDRCQVAPVVPGGLAAFEKLACVVAWWRDARTRTAASGLRSRAAASAMVMRSGLSMRSTPRYAERPSASCA